MKRQATEGVGVGNAVAAAGAEAHARCGEGWQWAQLEAKQRGCTKLQISPTVYSFLSTCGTAAGRRGDEGRATGGLSTVAPPTHPPTLPPGNMWWSLLPTHAPRSSSRAHLFPGEEASQREGPDAAEHAHKGQQPAGGGIDRLDLQGAQRKHGMVRG